MLYLLDENVLINAARDVYPEDRVPEFWRWLHHHVEAGNVKTLKPVCKKLKARQPEDTLARWIREHEVSILVEPAPAVLIRRVIRDGYGQPREAHLLHIEIDVLLVAAALAAPDSRTVGHDGGSTPPQAEGTEAPHSPRLRPPGRALGYTVRPAPGTGFPDLRLALTAKANLS